MLVIQFSMCARAGARATHRSEERDVFLYPRDCRDRDPLWWLVGDINHLGESFDVMSVTTLYVNPLPLQ